MDVVVVVCGGAQWAKGSLRRRTHGSEGVGGGKGEQVVGTVRGWPGGKLQ